mgnify:CR=1 FL=1
MTEQESKKIIKDLIIEVLTEFLKYSNKCYEMGIKNADETRNKNNDELFVFLSELSSETDNPEGWMTTGFIGSKWKAKYSQTFNSKESRCILYWV